jgi:predicted Zn-dependent peptidase
MYQDNPEEVVHDIYASNVFKNHPLGYPVLGEQRSVMEIKREDIIRYINNNYRPDNTVIAVTGNVELKDIERYAQKYFSNWGDRYTKVERYDKPTINFNHVIKQRDTEQVHFCLGFKGLNQKDKRLYSFLALNNLLGGGMSSRLFQRVREEMGLVYSIYSYPTTYRDIGMLTVYAGTNPSQLGNVLEAVVEEFRKLKEYGIPENELRRVKEQMKGNYILSMEGTGGRMSSMGKSELLLGKVYSQEEILDRIDGISIDSMQEIISESIDFKNMAATILGNVDYDATKALEMMV